MSDRSDAEREAARLERERRRARREGHDLPAEPAYEPPKPAVEPPVVAREPLPDDEAGPRTEPMRLEFMTADDDEDAPSGTRRISALDRVGDRPRRRVGRTGVVKLPRTSGRRSVRKRVGAGIALVLAAAVIWFVIELFQPFIGSPHGSVTVHIPHGASEGQIADLLAQHGVISSSFFFGLRATIDGDRGDLIARTYTLQRGMSYSKVLDILTTPPKPVPTSEVTLIPGKTRAQIGKLLNSQGVKGSYVGATRHSPLLNPRMYLAPRSTPDLEGFLFPDTYQLRKPIAISALVADQLTEFKQKFETVSMHYAESKKLTPYDVLIIASMVEAETPVAHDRPYVAAVIYNRLRLGMTLGIDATTRYATGNYTEPLTSSQINSSSPYNTRVHTGLPPTPIDSPSLASIEAAANPARSNVLYFVAAPCGNGRSTFTASYQQFLIDSHKYQNARAARGGKSPESCK